MKRIKALVCLLCCVLTVGAFAAVMQVSAAQPPVTVNVRIEGITQNIYYGDITVGEGSTVQDVLISLDTKESSLTITGAEYGYVTNVNGDGSGLTETGWDGWLVRVNGEALMVGIADVTVEDGDEIVLYYSDEFVSGMQYPEMDVTDIETGVIKFTSQDTVYDENYNASIITNPVVGMTVKWYVGEVATSYVTDENGEIKIDSDKLTSGDHKIEVERVENGVPTVLRLAPDTVVTVAEKITEAPTVGDGALDVPSKDNGGCSSVIATAVIPMALSLSLAGAVVIKKEK